jgi:hypothetical protein
LADEADRSLDASFRKSSRLHGMPRTGANVFA